MNMEHDEIIASWNKQADYWNAWNTLGEDEKLEWAIKLERESCAKVCDARYMGDNNREDMEARRCAEAIRARNNK